MIISHKNKFIFVHVPKTGGTSIAHALYPFLDLSQDVILGGHPNHESEDDEEKRKNGELYKHSSATEIREEVGEEIWRSYYVFACVRNPYSRMVSLYNWWWSTGNGDASKKEETRGVGFEEFVLSNYGGILARPQVEMICEESKKNKIPLDFRTRILVDGLIKQEELGCSFNYLCGLFDLPKLKLLRKNESLTEKDFKFQSLYNQNSYNYVTQSFQGDLLTFEYSFPPLKDFNGEYF